MLQGPYVHETRAENDGNKSATRSSGIRSPLKLL